MATAKKSVATKKVAAKRSSTAVKAAIKQKLSKADVEGARVLRTALAVLVPLFLDIKKVDNTAMLRPNLTMIPAAAVCLAAIGGSSEGNSEFGIHFALRVVYTRDEAWTIAGAGVAELVRLKLAKYVRPSALKTSDIDARRTLPLVLTAKGMKVYGAMAKNVLAIK